MSFSDSPQVICLWCVWPLPILTCPHNLTFLLRQKWKLNVSLELGHADSDSNWQEIKGKQRYCVENVSSRSPTHDKASGEWERKTGLSLENQQRQLCYLVIPLQSHLLESSTPTYAFKQVHYFKTTRHYASYGPPWWLSGKESICKADVGLIPGSETCPREGHGNPLQDSCLEDPMVRGAWQATVLGVSKEPDMTEWLNTNEHYLLSNARYHCWNGTATNLPNPARWKQALSMAPSSPSTTTWLSPPKLWTFMCLKHAFLCYLPACWQS